MALYKTDAIVLGHRNLGEADKILTLFSPDRGRFMQLQEVFAGPGILYWPEVNCSLIVDF